MSQINTSHISYRPDIDGLRALAVLSVVLFHAFPEWVHGGFIGVDIFFVISGYLISSIIYKGLDDGSFSFSDFYIRRIKRIFPALIIVLISCLIFGWFGLLSDEYQQLGKHAFGASTFTNNFMFWAESGYFDNDASTKPLLHLWSLSIEEQFYLLWPLLLCGIYKWKAHLGKVLLGLTVGFTLLHFYIFHPDRVAAFYAPYARFFELLIGACIAYQHLQPKTKAIHPLLKRFKSIQSFVGLGLILIGIQIITKESHFPGWYALLSPALGAALIIDSPQDSLLNRRLLSNKVVVWIGLISYPLYLWHWPLLSFGNIVASQKPLLGVRIFLIVLVFLLATLTYYFIEKPMRFGNSRTSKRKVNLLILYMAVIGITGGVVFEKKGFIERKAATPIIKHQGDTGHVLFHHYPYQHFYLCTPQHLQDEALRWHGVIRCFQSKKNQPIDLAIIGDSHAEHLFIGLSEAIPSKNIVYYTRPTLPIIGNSEFDHVFDYVLSNPDIKTIILDAYWSNRRNETPKNTSLFDGLTKTIQNLHEHHKEVIIIDDVPVFSFNPKQCKFVRPLSFKNNCIDDKNYFDKKYQTYASVFESLKKNKEVTIINTVPLLCDGKNCTMEKDGKLLYRDDQHLNIEGSRYIGKFIADEVKKKKLL
jgi:peptidoglycan/LPS O-acetylase OafA/YrhL